ncbi:bis(5'-nucleosyl)-tetraphosphatase (symmetrical) YqeK [Aerococcaceae bacterium WGS1372]
MTGNLTYTHNYINVSREELISNLKKSLITKRFEHVLRVEETALKLAHQYDYSNLEKVSIVALMHDQCKDMAESQMYQMASQFSPYEPIKLGNEAIWHGYAAAELARTNYKVQETDMINAIAEHTIGAKQMTLLSKILFVADYIEPGRDFPGVEKARELADKNLDKAVYYKMRQTIQHLVESKEHVYVESIVIYNYWTKRQED